MKKLCAAGALAGFLVVSANAASAGITRITGDIRAESIATASIFGAEARDFAEAELDPRFDKDTIGNGLSWADRSDVSAAMNGAFGMINAAASADLGSNAASFSTWVEGSAGVADEQTQQASAEHRTDANLFLYFDQPTLVDIVLRVEYDGSPDGLDHGYFGSVSLSGLAGQGPLEIETTRDGQAFFQELTVRAMVSDDPRPLILRLQTEADPNPEGLVVAEIGRLSVSASITVVPGPGTGALAACGLAVAGRRRRIG